ncbi:transposase [Streptomyces sp. NBC_00272]|uniref:transposase n=1 Tax=Streptomyces sp. NBC_00272 TaxID=2975698 RepID=UPI002E280B95|nr:transposase [Streptomyces sp. NBC_00272]
MTDAEWAVVRDAMPVPAWLEGRGGQPESYCHRQLVDAVCYLIAGGIAGRAVPADFPAWNRFAGSSTAHAHRSPYTSRPALPAQGQTSSHLEQRGQTAETPVRQGVRGFPCTSQAALWPTARGREPEFTAAPALCLHGIQRVGRIGEVHDSIGDHRRRRRAVTQRVDPVL